MFCRKCGKMIQEDDLFCSQCGTTIVETPACALNTSDSEGVWLQKAGNLQQESSSRSDALIPSLDRPDVAREKREPDETQMWFHSPSDILPNSNSMGARSESSAIRDTDDSGSAFIRPEYTPNREPRGTASNSPKEFLRETSKPTSPKPKTPAFVPTTVNQPTCAKAPARKKISKKAWIIMGAAAAALVVILAVAIPVILKNAPVSETQITSDMRRSISQFTDESFSFDSVNISKRQTDTSRKTDIVYLEWTAHNGVCSVKNEAVMTYRLYNDGWRFEDVDSRRSKTTITASDVSSDSARSEVESSYISQKYEGGDISEVSHDTDLTIGEDVFVYNYKVYFYYCTRTYTAQVKYKFYNTKWVYDSIEWDDGVSEWDIVGEWSCRTENAQVWVKFLSFEDCSGQVEYTVKFDYDGWYYYGVQNFHTDEPVNVYGSKQTDLDRDEYLEIELPSRNASSEHAEAGYLKLYPSRMYWKSLHAKDSVYVMERSDGDTSTALSELFLTDDNRYWYWPLEYTDPDGITHSEWYEFSSYKSQWNHDIESYILCELDRPYSTISGTYFCDPKTPSNVGISLYIYADGVCVYKDEHLHLGDGIHTFEANISGKSTLRVSVICDDADYYCGTDGSEPTTILVDTYLN